MSPEAHLQSSAEVGLEARLQSSPFLNQPPIFTPLPARLTCLKEALKQDNTIGKETCLPLYVPRTENYTRECSYANENVYFTFDFSSIFRSLLPLLSPVWCLPGGTLDPEGMPLSALYMSASLDLVLRLSPVSCVGSTSGLESTAKATKSTPICSGSTGPTA